MSTDGPDEENGPRYEVGYGRPPKSNRFRPGQSGNPRGRPKGRRNLKLDLQEELSERITIREADRQIRISKQRALVKSTVARAIKGDVRAQAKLYELVLRAFGLDEEDRSGANLSEQDEAILENFLKRQGEVGDE